MDYSDCLLNGTKHRGTPTQSALSACDGSHLLLPQKREAYILGSSSVCSCILCSHRRDDVWHRSGYTKDGGTL